MSQSSNYFHVRPQRGATESVRVERRAILHFYGDIAVTDWLKKETGAGR